MIKCKKMKVRGEDDQTLEVNITIQSSHSNYSNLVFFSFSHSLFLTEKVETEQSLSKGKKSKKKSAKIAIPIIVKVAKCKS